MIIKNIALLNIKDNFKNISYLLMTCLFSVMGAFLLIYQGKNYLIMGNLAFLLNYMYFVFNLSIFTMVMTVTIGNVCVMEKTSGRLEYYLSNMVDLKNIHFAYTVSTSCLAMFALIIFNIFLLLYCLIMKDFIMLNVLYNPMVFICFILFLFFGFGLSYLLNIMVLISKKPQTVRSILFFTSFVVMYGTMFPVTLIAKIESISGITIIIIMGLFFFVMSIIIAFVILFLMKFLKKEMIILSLKQ